LAKLPLVGRAPGGGAATWDVTNYSNVIGSWRADDGITNATGAITNLPDRGANAWALTPQGASIYKSNNWLNGHSIAKFVYYGLQSFAFTNSGFSEIALVEKIDVRDTDHSFFERQPNGNGTQLPYSAVFLYTSNRFGVSGVLGTSVCMTNVWQIIFIVHAGDGNDGVITNNVRAYTISSSNDTLTNSNNGILFGSGWDGNGGRELAEWAFFSGTNTDARRAEITTNLEARYGLPITP